MTTYSVKRLLSLEMKSIPRSALVYFCVALIGAVGLTVLEQITKVERAIVIPPQVNPQPRDVEKITEPGINKVPDETVTLPSVSQLGPDTSRPFAKFKGSWSGAGVVTLDSGIEEPIRCRAIYTVASAGSDLNLTLGCASESYRFDLSTNVVAAGTALSGNWSEGSRHASGTLDGRVSGGDMEFLIKGDGFSATLAVETRGDQQKISIRQENTNFLGMEIALSR
jgi:hypothetical protein